jgi:hypothetical protein
VNGIETEQFSLRIWMLYDKKKKGLITKDLYGDKIGVS